MMELHVGVGATVFAFQSIRGPERLLAMLNGLSGCGPVRAIAADCIIYSWPNNTKMVWRTTGASANLCYAVGATTRMCEIIVAWQLDHSQSSWDRVPDDLQDGSQ